MFCTVIVLQFLAYSNQTRQPKTYWQNSHFAQICRYFIIFIYAFIPKHKKPQEVSAAACHGIAGQCQELQTAGGYVLFGTVYSFKLNGSVYEAQTRLESAKQGLKELPADYEYYSTLKDFYTTTSALVDYCGSPSGSLDQYKVLLNDYRKEARDYINDLDFVFE